MQPGFSTSFNFINIFGSKKLESGIQQKIILAKKIGAELMRVENWILLNGGALGLSKKEPTAIDHLVCLGAKDELKKIGGNETQRILTLHPQESEIPLHSIGRVEITKRKSRAFRRYDLVSRAHAIITIEGSTSTRQVIELAMASETPILPIPCTGGQSKEAWEDYESEILTTFQISKGSTEYEILHNGLGIPAKLANVVINLVKTRLMSSCFIAMPLKSEFDKVYNSAIAAALIESGYNPIRPDKMMKPGNIMQQIIESIRKSSIFLADITGLNPNVMYELGMAHILGKPIVLISQTNEEGKSRNKIPFDISTERILQYNKKSTSHLKKSLTSLLEYLK